MDLEMRHLRAFVAVVDAGSFTDAALDLNTSQASVSRSVAALELALGVKVLRRTTREMSLTSAGARVLGPARRILNEVEAMVETAQQTTSVLRIGHAWSALGRHTVTVQKQWAMEFPGSELVFVQTPIPTAAVAENLVDVAVVRRPTEGPRLSTALVGMEKRYAAVPAGDSLARRRSVSLNDLADRAVAIDESTGTTTLDLWPPDTAPAITRPVRGIDDWLNLIAAGQAVGISAEATTYSYPRPGIRFLPVRDAEPIQIWLIWRRRNPPDQIDTLVQLVRETYAAD